MSVLYCGSWFVVRMWFGLNYVLTFLFSLSLFPAHWKIKWVLLLVSKSLFLPPPLSPSLYKLFSFVSSLVLFFHVSSSLSLFVTMWQIRINDSEYLGHRTTQEVNTASYCATPTHTHTGPGLFQPEFKHSTQNLTMSNTQPLEFFCVLFHKSHVHCRSGLL